MATTLTSEAVHEEFDRQVQTLVDLGYPALTDRSEADLRELLEP